MPGKDPSSKFEKALLRFLSRLGDQKVDLADPETGAVDVVSRAEALARTVWAEALGYSVYADEEDETGKMRRVFKSYRAPDKAARGIIFDYLLGRPKPHVASKKDEKKPQRVPVHERVGSALVSHLNQLTETDDANSGSNRGKDKAGPTNPISERIKRMGMSKNRSPNSEGPDGESQEA